jgi:hypothetical protein
MTVSNGATTCRIFFLLYLLVSDKVHGVPSHSFFIYIDGLVDTVRASNVSCYVSCINASIFLHASDIILAPTITALEVWNYFLGLVKVKRSI